MAEDVGPMKRMPACSQDSREVRVLGEEAVAGVDGVGAGATGDVKDQITPQIRFRGRRESEAVRFVGLENVGSGTVGVGVDGDGGNAQLTAGTQNAECDFAPVGDKDFTEHRKTGYSVQGAGYREMKSPRFGRGLLS